MIFWIERKHKNEYLNSAKSNGIRYKFIDDFDDQDKNEITNFILFIRKKYYFPISFNFILLVKNIMLFEIRTPCILNIKE